MSSDYTQISSLIAQIHTSLSNFLRFRLSQEGLPDFASSHGFILYTLSIATEALTMSDLAESINKDKSTTTALVIKLEKAGLVERSSSNKDKRVVYIKLSKQGASYADSLATISKELTETCYKNFTEKEKKTVFSLLNKISSNFANVT